MLEQNLKQRLLGAAVLIGVGIIVIPFLLGEPTDITLQSERQGYVEAHESSLPEREVPSNTRKNSAFVSAVKWLPEQNRQELSNPEGSGQEEALSSPLPTRETTLSASTEPAHSSVSGSPEIVGGWFIQIGSFTHQKNALRMRNDAASSGYRVFIKTIKNGTKTVYKVRVGPERDKVRATELKEELEGQMQIKAFIVSPSNG
ncbi:SPOR domain-containing protein [Nitrosococcus wardiae]|uniref:SPOR domain-containing protein n=1 Tax=Nitrosococcus wardiae TaxID=1814290 RepID=A0A4P7C1Q7_9GAMM|nr:SPOR domain-containing protein [Nitrosococcus wardiae]QBQ55404.1 SPOR domain-containing protein [Nitrosococcus wardiae]